MGRGGPLGLDDKNRMPNGLPVNQHQFDALLSFTYNVGTGNFAHSTLLRKVKANPKDPSIRGEFARWVYGGCSTSRRWTVLSSNGISCWSFWSMSQNNTPISWNLVLLNV